MAWRRRRNEPPLAEEQAYAHSYGERSGDVFNVAPMPPPPPHEPPRQRTRMTDRGLRDAFRSRLDKRVLG